jgi:hypothetical protein
MSEFPGLAPSIVSEVSAHLGQAKQVSTLTQTMTINTEDEYQNAAASLVALKGRWKAAEDRRTSMVKPLNDVVKNINGLFRPVLDEWDVVMTVVKAAMQDYQQRKNIEQRQQLALAAQMAQQGQTGVEFTALVAQGSAMPVQAKGISNRVIWRWKVVNAAAVPREYLCLDAGKLDTVAREHKGSVAVPGIEFYTGEILAVRT